MYAFYNSSSTFKGLYLELGTVQLKVEIWSRGRNAIGYRLW